MVMKLTQIQKLYTQNRTKPLIFVFAVFAAIALNITFMQQRSVSAVTSGELRAQSDELQKQIEANAERAKELQSQAESLKKTIAELDIQIANADVQLQITAVHIAELQLKLDKTQAELDHQKELLKASMRALYKKGGVSTVELLVGSDSFSDFINDQEYLDRLKSSVQQSAEQVVTLKLELEAQKQEQLDLQKKQEEQKRAIEETKTDRSNLLVQTEGDEVRYKNLMAQQIADQKEVNRQLFAQIQLERGSGNNGGYPYDDWPFSMMGPGCPSGDGPDRWNYCTRQCVSYAAWAVERSGRRAPFGYGDARDWVWHSQSDGIPGGYSPQAGDVAIYTGGTWGHAQYVEAVYGDGTMRISQYNALLDGKYSEATVSSSRSGWYYIHF